MKKNNALKGCIIGFSLILVSLSAMYLGLSKYYSGGFSYGTWVNGVYCTGKSINEINDELLKKYDYEGLTIFMGDGKSYTISAEEVKLSFSFEESLKLYQERQNPYLWIDNLKASAKDKTIQPVIEYDRELFEKKLKSFGITDGKNLEDGRVMILKGDNGYYLVNERAHAFDGAMAKRLICSAFENLKPEIDLEAAGCYRDLPLTEDMKDTLRLWDMISEYQDCGIIYQMGEKQVPVDPGDAADFLLLDSGGDFVMDEDGKLCTDENKVYAFVDALADKYDTVGATRLFHATRGETVTVEGGIYGNEIDREAEKEYLLDAFLNKKSGVHTPEYRKTAQKQGLDDIGDTYIEVDMTEQKLYYYEEGRLVIETDVVTGDTSLGRGTPCGTNYVYAKQKNRILRGEDYEIFVKYWIPVKGAIGIHDASWRSKYGGEIYKTNGSHGCVNTPLDEVEKLYDMVEIGTPCVMFY